MPPPSEPPKHREVNAVARNLNAEFTSLPFEAIRRSVLRHWPDEKKAREEVIAKAEQPCVLGIHLIGTQGLYVKLIQKDFYPVKGSSPPFPYLGSAFRHISTNDVGQHTWLDVLQKLNAPSTPHVHWINVACPAGVVPSVERYEALYEKLVLEEGIKDIIGFVHACDGTLPFGDYIAQRHRGASMEEVAAAMNFDALRDEALRVGACLKQNSDDDDAIWLIAPDGEEAELQAEAEKAMARLAAAPKAAGENAAPVAVTRTCVPLTRLSEDVAAAQAKRLYRPFNLFNNDPATAIPWRENKAGMHRRLAERGLNHIRSVELVAGDDVVACMTQAKITFPVVVKPVSGAGSEFVTLCHNVQDVETALGLCKDLATTQRTSGSLMVMEDYIDGPEYVVNIVSYEGRHVVTDVWRSWKYPKTTTSTRLRVSVEKKLKEKAVADGSTGPVAVETTSLLYDRLEFVYGLAELEATSEPRRVVSYTLAAITALGMVNGCSHCEVRVDAREGSPTSGQPVLIELNPRMQGDAPRATQLVGYDQYTLLYYLSAVAAAYQSPREEPCGLLIPQATGSARCSLPWPPVPELYRSRQPRLSPGEEPITRHVVFLTAPEGGVVNALGVNEVTSLSTFLRVTRSHLFTAPQPGHVTVVNKTVDLYSSPGACVMEGTESAIRADTARIRELEMAQLPPHAVSQLQAALEERKALRQAEVMCRELGSDRAQEASKFAGLERRVAALERAVAAEASRALDEGQGSSRPNGGLNEGARDATDSSSTRSGDHSFHFEDSDSLAEGEDLVAQPPPQADYARRKSQAEQELAECRERMRQCSIAEEDLRRRYKAWQQDQAELRAAVQAHVKQAFDEILAAPDPPLFLERPMFDLLLAVGGGHLVALPDFRITNEEEEAAALVVVKHPRLRELSGSEESASEHHFASGRSALHERLDWFRRLFA